MGGVVGLDSLAFVANNQVCVIGDKGLENVFPPGAFVVDNGDL